MPMLWIHIKALCHTSALPWHPQEGITSLILLVFFLSLFWLQVCVCVCVCVYTHVDLRRWGKKVKTALICEYIYIHMHFGVCMSVCVFRIGEKSG